MTISDPGACVHAETWFDRSFCAEPCGSMHNVCVDCGSVLDHCEHYASADRAVCQKTNRQGFYCMKDKDHDGPCRTNEQAQAAQAELDELERTDPDVAAAAASYDRMVERMTPVKDKTVRYDLAESPGIGMSVIADAAFEAPTVGLTPPELWTQAYKIGTADAAQRIHAQYEAVAERIAKAAANPGLPESNARLLNVAAAEIRKVADK